MKNYEVAKAFARGAKFAKGGNLFVEGDVIYSYGYHYPAAVRVSDTTAVVNARGYSSTTAHHLSDIRRALLSAGVRYINTTEILPASLEDARKVADVEREKMAAVLKSCRPGTAKARRYSEKIAELEDFVEFAR